MTVFKTVPYFSYPVWSGKKLNAEWNKVSDNAIGESWELSVIENKSSFSDCDAFAGIPMNELIAAHPEWTNNGVQLLFKFISTDQNLSVQVHPDDEYAKRVENSLGKTESWYILDCEKGAVIYLGLKENVTKQQLKDSLLNGTVLELLNRIEVKKGDYYFIPAGTIHALGQGVTVAEIQQSSNITYRLYDYNRLQNGKPRELHVEKSLDVCSLEKTSPESLTPEIHDGVINVIKECDYFTSSLLNLCKNSTPVSYFSDDYSILTVLSGGVSIDDGETVIKAKKGDTVFVSRASVLSLSSETDCSIYINSTQSR